MTKMEARYRCPVCLGATLEKVRLQMPGTEGKKGSVAALVLDHCPRCGGVWFEHGEVQQLRRVDPAELWTKIVKRTEAHRMQCHNGQAHVARTLSRCGTCGWKIELDCPLCQKPMSDTRTTSAIASSRIFLRRRSELQL